MDILSEYTESFEKALNILDFAKIKMVMGILNWEWVGCGSPKEEDMRETCWNLFLSAVKQLQRERRERCSAASGGFQVIVTLGENGHVEIEFILENSIWFKNWKGE